MTLDEAIHHVVFCVVAIVIGSLWDIRHRT